MRTPIKVDLLSSRDELQAMSRINLRTPHTTNNNWKVWGVGHIADDSWEVLWHNYYTVQGFPGYEEREEDLEIEGGLDNKKKGKRTTGSGGRRRNL